MMLPGGDGGDDEPGIHKSATCRDRHATERRLPRFVWDQRGLGPDPMPTAKAHALVILSRLEQAQADLDGKCVILTDGKAGTVEKVWLDELHGLRISIAGHDGKWPVSTIKLAQR